MPFRDDPVLKALVDHIDQKLSHQDEMRQSEFAGLAKQLDSHGKKLDDHTAETRLAQKEFSAETRAQFTLFGTKLTLVEERVRNNSDRIDAINEAGEKASERKDGYLKTLIAAVLGGGGIWVILDALMNRGKP